MSETTNKNNKFAIVILLIVLLLSIISISVLNSSKGTKVLITQDGHLLCELELGSNQSFEIKNQNGELTNRITIENGYAFMEYAKCSDHTCMNMGKIRHNNQSVVCLPNRVVVSISDEKEPKYDSVVQ